MSETPQGENENRFSHLETNQKFIENGWKGSALEPVVEWPVADFQEGDKYTVVLRNAPGYQDYYNHEGDIELPGEVEGVEWRRVYELREGQWEVVKEEK